VIGYTEIALEDLPQDHETAQNLREVLKAGQRAKALVRQILAFSRQSEPEFKPLRIDLIVEEALKLIRASLPTTLTIRQEIHSTATVLADATQIHQVILNLATNAAHAMETGGGELRVALDEFRSAGPIPTIGGRLSPGRYLKLTLADTGSGIPKELQERIFDPFFTTKDRQQGTGMGLAVVHGIVSSHHGGISLASRPGAGTCFEIYLPIAGLDEEQQSPTPAKGKGGSEHILLVDDEPTIIEMIGHILENLGYRVTAHNESPEALAAFQGEPEAFDLVITDMTMPRLTGDRLAAEMLALRPELPVILCTGYSKEITDSRIREIGIRRLIYKPVEMNELARIIRQTLDANEVEEVPSTSAE
ncbi:MAG: ATP-binding protein, partial [Desulfobacterales bacterium]